MALVGSMLMLAGALLASCLYLLLGGAFGDVLDSLNVEQIKMIHEVFGFTITGILVGGAVLIYHQVQQKMKVERESLLNRESKEKEDSMRRAEDRASLRQRQEAFFHDFVATYNRIKFDRREINRSLSVGGGHSLTSQKYEEMMKNLNSGQLELEAYKRLSECCPVYLDPIKGIGKECFRSAEKYLRRVTREYETCALDSKEDGLVFVDENSKLYEFVSSRSRCVTAHEEFFRPLDKIFLALAGSIGAKATDFIGTADHKDGGRS